jgi:signal transduction histidine kinase
VGEIRTRPGGEAPGRRPEAEPPASPDLDLVVARAAEGLGQAVGARAVVALGRAAAGGARVVAQVARGVTPDAPPLALLEALAPDLGPVDLGRPDASAVEREAAAAGWGAAAAVGRGSEAPWALLVVAAAEDPPGRVRPRSLAALGAAARRLEGPVSAAAAGARLARLDADVQRLGRLAALGDLVAEIAHEVRNPLVSVKTFLQLLPDRIDDPEFRTRFHEVVADELRRIERLLDVVIAHARPGPAAPGDRTAAGPVFDAVARLLEHRALESGVRIEVDPAGAEVEAPLGEDALRQVVLNLTLNAIEATAEGGDVRLSARRLAEGAELRVEDRGPGVPPEARERIFEPFHTTRPDRPGGLGLAISRRLVEQAGGELAVGDREGGGASFRIRFGAGTLV